MEDVDRDTVGRFDSRSIRIHPLPNYSFGSKAGKEDGSVRDRMQAMRETYAEQGMRRSVDGIIVVHQHGHPHILLLQHKDGSFALPGGRLRPGESERQGLFRKLDATLGPVGETPEWKVDELVCTWWRPHFEKNLFPYLPPHITKPKECKKQFLVILPSKCSFAVPSHLRLMAVSLFDLYNNVESYGPLLCALPQLLGRFSFAPV